MDVLGIILARAGSKGLPNKCVKPLLDRPLIEYTFDHALASRRLGGLLLTTDSAAAIQLAKQRGIETLDRPANLASDTAGVDAAARHAVEYWEGKTGRAVDAVALLYGNIPIRREGIIDDAIEHLERTEADSVRTVAPITKHHPDWIHRLDGDRMVQFRSNGIYRRQDLEPLYYHDGAVAVVRRSALLAALQDPDNGQAFLGDDRRAIIQACEDTVDVDTAMDLSVAEALMSHRAQGAKLA